MPIDLARPLRFRVAIRASEDRWPPRDGYSSVELAALQHLHQVGGIGQPKVTSESRSLLPATAQGPALSPIVNHGRWLVMCPACPAAVYASREDHRFLCGACGNTLDGGQWLPVEWPAETPQIEVLLGARRYKEQRNWAPPETVADLAADNQVHGVM